jgi:hypothetical protein
MLLCCYGVMLVTPLGHKVIKPLRHNTLTIQEIGEKFNTFAAYLCL